jgi:hypothetical protein
VIETSTIGRIRVSQDAIPLDDVSLHILGDEAILFDRRRQRFYAANASAAFIWACLEERQTPEQTIELLVGQHGLDRELACQSVAQVIGQWEADEDEDGGLTVVQAPGLDKVRTDVVPVAGPERNPRLTAIFQARHYRLLDSAITLRFETASLLKIVDELFQHLAIAERPPEGTVFDLVVHEGGYAILENGQILDWCRSRDGIAVMAKICVIRRALEQSRDFCAIHAGLVRCGGKCLLLPAESGAGKSTLVAGLAAAGYEIWGDDTAVLTVDSFQARPVPCGIGLKPGSWPILAGGGFPRLAQAPIHTRPDGKRVRYLLPPDYAVADAMATAPIGWIVFPRFDAGAQTALVSVSKAEALRRLLPGFVRLGSNDLEASHVAQLVRWVDGVPAYDLHLSSLDEAIILLDGLTAT